MLKLNQPINQRIPTIFPRYLTEKPEAKNPNPVTIYGGYHHFSANTPKGQVSDVVLKGLTATNIVTNGDFSNGATGWTIPSSQNVTLVSANNGILTVKLSVINSQFTKMVQQIRDHKYYVKIVSTSDNIVEFSIAGVSALQLNSPNFSKTSNVYTWFSNTRDNWGIIFKNLFDGETEISLKELFIIDLTQTFGTGNEPTVEQCDLMFANYFDGTKSTNSVRIRSVNEDETKESIVYVNLPQGEELRSLPNGLKMKLM